MREKDDGGGRRVVKPTQVSSVDEEYCENVHRQSQQQQINEENLEADANEPIELDLSLKASSIFNNTFSGLVLLLGGLLAIYLFTQTVVFIGEMMSYPEAIRYPAFGILGLLVLIVLWSIIKLCTSYYKLRRNRQIQFEEIRDLNKRKLLTEAVGKKRQAKAQLIKYLSSYNLSDTKFNHSLNQAMVSREELGALAQQKERLLHEEFEDTQRWLEEFRDKFQATQNQAVDRIVKKYAMRIGIGTAAVPKGLIDSLIVTWGSVNMLNEICKVYNLRLGRIGTFVLLGRVFRNVFIAGILEDVTDETTQMLFNSMKDSLPGIGLIKRPAEGLVNALLIRRLGYGAKKMIQPIA